MNRFHFLMIFAVAVAFLPPALAVGAWFVGNLEG